MFPNKMLTQIKDYNKLLADNGHLHIKPIFYPAGKEKQEIFPVHPTTNYNLELLRLLFLVLIYLS